MTTSPMSLFCSGLTIYGKGQGNYSGIIKMSNVIKFKLDTSNS